MVPSSCFQLLMGHPETPYRKAALLQAEADVTMAPMAKRKNPAAVALGRLGGRKKTDKPKGPAALSPERRQEIARKAAAARWKKDEK
jgi:hypothetical protein